MTPVKAIFTESNTQVTFEASKGSVARLQKLPVCW